ncbi:RNA polymerase sigma factor [Pedobacter agri]|uniref:RNA polymerase sigma factor n=1 Tax=Pedobacter agri TaxID=454586 RepID=UPI002930AD57|nr:RNA polymerase sigma factor [Pedobacter agri]
MTPQEKTDDELIAMCREGDEIGYAGLYKKYSKSVYNSIHRFVLHTADAEDILQETFVSVFRDITQLDHVLNVGAWVKRIAVNKSISHLRKSKIQFSDLVFTEIEAEQDYNIQQDRLFENRLEDVKTAISQLPDGYRSVVTLYVYEKLSHEEIGKMLGISANTVRTHYHRAKKKILVTLKNKSYHE